MLFKFLFPSFGLYFDKDADGGGVAGVAGDPNPPQPKTIQHTQEQLDAMFAERASQAKRAALDELFKTLGVKDGIELTALFAEGKKLKESQLSELEKLAKEKSDIDTALTTEKTAHADTVKKFTERLLKAEILAEAKKAGFRDESLGDVWMLVNAEHRTKITEKDDAFVGVDKVVEEIKKAKPFWLATQEPQRKSLGTPKSQRKPGDGQPTDPRKSVLKTL